MQQRKDEAVEILAQLLQLQPIFIFDALQKIGNYQKRFIRKKSGGHREIDAPADELMVVQEQILKLLYRWRIHKYQFGFRPYGSPVENARHHIRKGKHVPRWVLNLDLKNAFPSVKSKLLKQEFKRLFHPQNFQDLPQVEEEVFDEFIQLMLDLTNLPRQTPSRSSLLALFVKSSTCVDRRGRTN